MSSRWVGGLLLWALLAGGCGLLDSTEAGLRAYNDGRYAEAARIWANTARQGDATAQYYLGRLYESGVGGRQDYALAARYYTSAARQQHPYAQAALAILYAYGKGLPQDFTLSYRWSSLAAANYPKWAKDERVAAQRNREIVAARMSAPELLAAQRAVDQSDRAE